MIEAAERALAAQADHESAGGTVTRTPQMRNGRDAMRAIDLPHASADRLEQAGSLALFGVAGAAAVLDRGRADPAGRSRSLCWLALARRRAASASRRRASSGRSLRLRGADARLGGVLAAIRAPASIDCKQLRAVPASCRSSTASPAAPRARR